MPRRTHKKLYLPILLGLPGCLGGAEAMPPEPVVLSPTQAPPENLALGCGDWRLIRPAGASVSLYRGARSLSIDLFPGSSNDPVVLQAGNPVGDVGLVASVILTGELPEGARAEWGLAIPGDSVPVAAVRLEREGLPSVRLVRRAREGESAMPDGTILEGQRVDTSRGSIVLQRRGGQAVMKALWGRSTMVQRADVGAGPLELRLSLSWPRGGASARGRSLGLVFERFEVQDTGGRVSQDLLACP